MRAISEEALARSLVDPSCRCEASQTMGATLLSVGELAASKQLLRRGARRVRRRASAAFRARFGPWRVHLRVVDARAVAPRRRGGRGLARSDYAIALARRRDHKYSETLAFAYAGLLHQMRRDTERTLACAEAAVGIVRALRIRVLRRLGERADRMGARTERARPKASGSSKRRSSGSTRIVRKHAGRTTCRCWRETYSRLSERDQTEIDSRSRDWDGARARRCLVAARALPSEKRARERAGARSHRFSTRSRWRGHNKAARSSSGFSRRQSRHRTR